jgi:hypothetical protein
MIRSRKPIVRLTWASQARLGLAAVALMVAAPSSRAESRYTAARASILASQLQQHVAVLADDIYEGRLAGSRGGRAAGNYILDQIDHYELTPAGLNGTFFQPYSNGYRNILAMRAGTDPALADEIVLVSAHYDHVGYGSDQTSYGPTGYIHNGADDNASGVSALLETIEAFHIGNVQTRRGILFTFWDGEELGLVGSKHWVAHPTVPLESVRLMVNIDMVGWLRDGRLEICGTRSGYGSRQLLCGVERPLWLDFSWQMESNSDHWTFFQRQIPVALIHTGLHNHYHRPTDDVERINVEGLQDISRYMFEMLVKVANADRLPTFRAAARYENADARRQQERPTPSPPPRIGIRWQLPPAANSSSGGGANTLVPIENQGIIVTHVVPGSPAAEAGIRTGDNLVALDGVPTIPIEKFQQTLLSAERPLVFSVVRNDRGTIRNDPVDAATDASLPDAEPLALTVQPAGPPIRIGISWRADAAEPQSVYLTHVVPGSAAGAAGLKVYDRIYEVDGQRFADKDDFGLRLHNAVNGGAAEISLLVESYGRLRPVTLQIAESRPDIAQNSSRGSTTE